MIRAGAPVARLNDEGVSPFLVAVKNGQLDTLDLLLGEQDINVKNEAGNTAVLEALKRGYPALVSPLLDMGASPTLVDNSQLSPIYYASLYGFADAAKALLDAGAMPTWQHEDGRSALLAAAYGAHQQVVTMLVRAGARPVDRDTYQEDLFATGLTQMAYGDLQIDNGNVQAAVAAYGIARDRLGKVADQYEQTSNEFAKRAKSSAMWDAVAQGIAQGIGNYAAQQQAQAQGQQLAQLKALSDAQTQQQYFALNRQYQQAAASAPVMQQPGYTDPFESNDTQVLKKGQIVYAERAMRARAFERQVKYRQRCAEAGRMDMESCIEAVAEGRSP